MDGTVRAPPLPPGDHGFVQPTGTFAKPGFLLIHISAARSGDQRVLLQQCDRAVEQVEAFVRFPLADEEFCLHGKDVVHHIKIRAHVRAGQGGLEKSCSFSMVCVKYLDLPESQQCKCHGASILGLGGTHPGSPEEVLGCGGTPQVQMALCHVAIEVVVLHHRVVGSTMHWHPRLCFFEPW